MADLYLSTEGPQTSSSKSSKRSYPTLTIDPSMSHELILYRAGERSVVEWIKANYTKEN